MDRNEALRLLELPANAGTDDVLRRYRDLCSEFQVRLSNAPTPALKRTYQRTLAELQEAYNALSAKRGDAPVDHDLPSPEPVFFLAAEDQPRGKAIADSPPAAPKRLGSELLYSRASADDREVPPRNAQGRLVRPKAVAFLFVALLGIGVLAFGILRSREHRFERVVAGVTEQTESEIARIVMDLLSKDPPFPDIYPTLSVKKQEIVLYMLAHRGTRAYAEVKLRPKKGELESTLTIVLERRGSRWAVVEVNLPV